MKKFRDTNFSIFSKHARLIKITDPRDIEKIEALLEALDNEDDVMNVAVNYSGASSSSG